MYTPRTLFTSGCLQI